MPEWRKIFEAEDSECPGASCLEGGDHRPNPDRSRPRSVPKNAPAISKDSRRPRNPHRSHFPRNPLKTHPKFLSQLCR